MWARRCSHSFWVSADASPAFASRRAIRSFHQRQIGFISQTTRVTRATFVTPRWSYSSSSAVNNHKISDPTSLKEKATEHNPTVDWKGAARSTSGFVCHYIASHPITPLEAVTSSLAEKRQNLTVEEIQSNTDEWEFVMAPDLNQAAQDLIQLGSVWYLEADATRDPSLGEKPQRLALEQANTIVLQEGDYLRIHFEPRRFKTVYDYDWDKMQNETTTDDNSKPGVIVAEDTCKGYLIINKPRNVPVHQTVDNALENVQSCVFRSRKERLGDTTIEENQNPESELYVSTPQRLDQNTSGLLVLATSKRFAAYFAKLLSNKTELMQQQDAANDDAKKISIYENQGIHKVYKCLVCLMPPNEYSQNATAELPLPDNNTPWSVGKAMQQLNTATGQVTRHWLQPSIRAPKRYYATPPAQECIGSQPWLESLLRITSVGPICTLVGNKASEQLGNKLWGQSSSNMARGGIPPGCQAVAEVSVELLTGRTHQIRGQLAAMGFPLVGDCQYGGAIPIEDAAFTPLGQSVDNDAFYFYSERLALQCSQLEFLDPELDHNNQTKRRRRRKQDGPTYKPSEKWNRFELERTWWSEHLDEYKADLEKEGETSATTALNDLGLGLNAADATATEQPTEDPDMPRPDLLPDPVQLSPGKNKYVLVRAFYPPRVRLESDIPRDFWFVKSATPKECGGPYHGNVAQDLREWIEAAGFEVQVTGGGRIDYDPEQNRCIVYGFSYGFGKGNHDFAAKLIQKHVDIPAIADNTDGLY